MHRKRHRQQKSPVRNQMLDLTVFKAVIINVFKELEETMLKEVNRD